MSRFAAVPGDQAAPFNDAALLARSPLSSVVERKPFERLRHALSRLLGLGQQENPFDRWLREECVTGLEAEGQRETTADLFVRWRAWTESRGINSDCVPGVGYGTLSFGQALDDRGIVVTGRDARGLRVRGPIQLRAQ